ncbi:MAG: serpin B [Ignavibacteria bacterium]|nr:MAG: serpin B [Ignavibacteria bacterium]KAF0155976.1 MAG: serpin B [Ignavibacteria bacterium]
MKLLSNLVLTVITFTFISCVDKVSDPIAEPPRELTVMEKQLVGSSDNFSFKLFKKVYEAEPGENLFISPLSVSMALGMTMNGADGTTYEAMKSTLSLNAFTKQQANETYQSLMGLLGSIDPKVILNIANSIWYNKNFSFQTDFIETNKKYFNAVVNAMNFGDPATITTINNWVKNATKDKIEKIVEQISPETIMYLINAIYFKGAWKHQFDKTKTYDDFFTTNEGKQVSVKMMRQENDYSTYTNNLFTAVDLPYSSGAFSMMLFLPNKSKNLKDAAEFLTKENFDSISKNFTISKKNLFLPRFKLEYKLKLNDALIALGMGDAFDRDKANFKKLYSGIGNAYISEVLHKTYVDVNEEGTEAAAVTSVEIGVTSIMDNNIKFDKPFLFLIREKNSGSILFIGTVNNPS